MSQEQVPYHCPKCRQFLVDFSTGKELTVSDGENEMVVGRLHVFACFDCGYIDYENAWFS